VLNVSQESNVTGACSYKRARFRMQFY